MTKFYCWVFNFIILSVYYFRFCDELKIVYKENLYISFNLYCFLSPLGNFNLYLYAFYGSCYSEKQF